LPVVAFKAGCDIGGDIQVRILSCVSFSDHICSSYWPPPDFSEAAFVASNATVIGVVNLLPGSSVWYGAVLRGDVDRIQVGASSNIQDGAILHGDPGQPVILEDFVTVGHRAVVHGAYIERGSLIGIGAVILNGVRVGTGSIIGAGAVVSRDVPPRSLVVGVPAKVVRAVSETEAADLISHAHKYEKLALVHAGKGNDLGFC
jgi:carbonic anhydrase/acetyltransferase-like protein (isoleucine patch superfamily)